MKPCNEPCPKCGNNDIHRLFRTVGDNWSSMIRSQHPAITTRWYKHDGYYCNTLADHIQHHCRCCQYEWFTDPLSTGEKEEKEPVNPLPHPLYWYDPTEDRGEELLWKNPEAQLLILTNVTYRIDKAKYIKYGWLTTADEEVRCFAFIPPVK